MLQGWGVKRRRQRRQCFYLGQARCCKLLSAKKARTLPGLAALTCETSYWGHRQGTLELPSSYQGHAKESST